MLFSCSIMRMLNPASCTSALNSQAGNSQALTGLGCPLPLKPDFKSVSALSRALRSNCLGVFQDLHPDTFREFSLWPGSNSRETEAPRRAVGLSGTPPLLSCRLGGLLTAAHVTEHLAWAPMSVAPGYLRDPDEGVQSEHNLLALLKLTSLFFLL